MQKQISLLGIVTICLALVIFYACKKQQLLIKKATIEDYKRAVTQLRLTSTNQFTKKDIARLDSIIKILDYTSAVTVHPTDSTILLLITVNSMNGKNFLGIIEQNQQFKFDGIYYAKNLGTIKTFFDTHILSLKDSILAWGVDKHPIKGWTTDNADNLLLLRGEGRSKGNSSIRNSQGAGYEVNSYNPEDPDELYCVAWFWILYDPYTGLVASSTYLFSTGPCDGFSSGSEPEQVNLLCGFTQDDFIDAFDDAKIEEINEVSMSFGSPYTDPLGSIKAAVTPLWKCINFNMGILGHEIISATYAGRIYRVNSIDNQWKWDFSKMRQPGRLVWRFQVVLPVPFQLLGLKVNQSILMISTGLWQQWIDCFGRKK